MAIIKKLTIEDLKEVLNRVHRAGSLKEFVAIVRDRGEFSFSDNDGFEMFIGEDVYCCSWIIDLNLKGKRFIGEFKALSRFEAYVEFGNSLIFNLLLDSNYKFEVAKTYGAIAEFYAKQEEKYAKVNTD